MNSDQLIRRIKDEIMAASAAVEDDGENDKYADSLCSSGDFLLEISMFPFAECTPYEHPQVSVCRVQGVIHLYAL